MEASAPLWLAQGSGDNLFEELSASPGDQADPTPPTGLKQRQPCRLFPSFCSDVESALGQSRRQDPAGQTWRSSGISSRRWTGWLTGTRSAVGGGAPR